MKISDNIVFIRQVFTDLVQLKTAADKWKLNFKQLDSGKLNGEMMILDTKHIQLGTVNFNRKFEQRGITPIGYRTFAIPADAAQFFKWRDYHIKDNYLMLFPASGEIDAVNYPGFKVFTFSLSEKLINVLLKDEEPSTKKLLPDEPEVLALTSQSMKMLRQSVSYLFDEVVQNPKVIEKAAFKWLMLRDIPKVLLSSLQTPIPKPKAQKIRIRDISFKKAISYLDSCTTDFPTVYELCLIAGASQRTLEYAFKEKYGVTPQDYMKKQRLNKIHQALIYADPKQNKVLEIAHQFGVWHMGQFSIDYKKLFGVLPSETLRNIN